MKILLCCHLPLEASYGGAKVYIETARSYEELGHEVCLVGLTQVFERGFELDLETRMKLYPTKLMRFLEEIITSFDFDIVEYEYLYLPIKRSKQLKNKIFVARSVLLEHHFIKRPIPIFKNLRSKISQLINGNKRKQELLKKISIGNKTMELADFINVPNYDDKKILIEHGHASEKIIVSPYGIYDERKLELEKTNLDKSDKQIISFIGTFDPRKGAVEFPKIIKLVKKEYPNILFRFIGTAALFPDKESIYNYFPKDLRDNIDVIPKFKPSDLALHLKNTNLGVFPSHMESFGFGILEMLAAKIPVVAYNVPGPNILLPEEYLLEAGDYEALSQKLLELLAQGHEEAYRPLASIVSKFRWPEVSISSLDIYNNAISKK